MESEESREKNTNIFSMNIQDFSPNGHKSFVQSLKPPAERD